MPPTKHARGAVRACALTALALTSHCASHPASHSTASTLSADALPCDVAEVLDAHCTQCHSSPPAYGAPMPLMTYADVTGTIGDTRVLDPMLERVTATPAQMPPPPNAPLTADDVATLQAWAQAGAPPSASTCSDEAGASTSTAAMSCTPDTFLRPQTPFVLDATTPLDDYVCYGVDLPAASPRQVIGIAPHIDDKQIVHHILLMQSDESYPSTPTPCSAGLSIDWRLVSAWAPGTQAFELPPEAGFPIGAGTTHWVVQVHYNNALGLASAQDQSGFDVCTTSTLRKYDAGIVAFGGTDIELPPYSTRTLDCKYTLPSGFEGALFFNALPHMHKLGTAISSVDTSQGTTIASQPAFSFSEQYLYPIDVGVHAGDVVETKCTWDNSTSQQVTFGEGTGNEMCFTFSAYYPLVADQDSPGAPIFNWITPSLGATCSME